MAKMLFTHSFLVVVIAKISMVSIFIYVSPNGMFDVFIWWHAHGRHQILVSKLDLNICGAHCTVVP